ncbi:pentapeptide repeat-containing protein [Calothrix sp. CCY 0018]|uniref:pentapeptide repeat-containing protein n=1 Tax=Calothrix sp. CCY 0018 TaxID=3103864 RepID=UPI0039C675C0
MTAEQLLQRYTAGERAFIGIILEPGTNLSGANLSGTNFSDADLAEANFTGAIFDNTSFIECTCRDTIWRDGTVIEDSFL